MSKPRPKSLIERKLENPEYRKLHEERYAAFKLEAQILLAMEKKNWTYSDLAEATHTSKSNVSRDLKAGGILTASFSRISRIADALGMKLIALLIPKDAAQYLLPRIERWIFDVSNSANVDPNFSKPITMEPSPVPLQASVCADSASPESSYNADLGSATYIVRTFSSGAL